LPMHSKRKAYIIDEVHMLTKEAFNALLKTLEEPPAHVMFILATTDPDKLPETIVSRCQTFVFKKPGVSVIREVIVRSAEKEGVTLDLGASELISLVADGSFRDAYGVLQKVMSAVSGKVITAVDVERVTGAPRLTLVHDFVVAIAHKETARALGIIRDVEKSNADMRLFTELVLERTRSVLYARLAPEVWKKTVVGMSVDDRKAIDSLAKDTKAVLSSATLSALLGAYSEISRSVIPAVPLEIAVLNLLA
jgi:DNA polymerase III subunit gamma/tau